MARNTPIVRARTKYDAEAARRFFAAPLELETDPSDLAKDLQGAEPPIVLDARTPDKFRTGHIPGAVNIFHRDINTDTTKTLPKDRRVVVYCTGVGCNAAKKAAVRLVDLGYEVQDLDGGLSEWTRQGYDVERS